MKITIIKKSHKITYLYVIYCKTRVKLKQHLSSSLSTGREKYDIFAWDTIIYSTKQIFELK